MRPVLSSMICRNPVLDTEGSPTIGKHLTVEGKTAVQAVLVKRGRDLAWATHLHDVARLEVKPL